MVTYNVTVGRLPRLFGLRQILIVGSSTSFGAASTGASNPKWSNSWPGRLRASLDGTYGAAGTGLILANNDVHTTPAWDGRITFGGTVTQQPLGWHSDAGWRCADGSSNYVELAATGTTGYVTCLAKSAGLGRVSVDGGASQTFRVMATGGTTPAIDKLPGYRAGHIVIEVPLGALGAHTIRVWGDGTDLDVVGLEVRTGGGAWVISNASINGKSMGSLLTSDETNGTYGLPLLDTAAASLPGLIAFGLGSNEWTTGTALATVQSRMATLATRAATAGRACLFFATPQPNPTLQGGSMTYTQMVDGMQSQCTTLGVPFINLQKLWTTPSETNEATMYADGSALGMFADTIHPNDAGGISIANAMRPLLLAAAA